MRNIVVVVVATIIAAFLSGAALFAVCGAVVALCSFGLVKECKADDSDGDVEFPDEGTEPELFIISGNRQKNMRIHYDLRCLSKIANQCGFDIIPVKKVQPNGDVIDKIAVVEMCGMEPPIKKVKAYLALAKKMEEK